MFVIIVDFREAPFKIPHSISMLLISITHYHIIHFRNIMEKNNKSHKKSSGMSANDGYSSSWPLGIYNILHFWKASKTNAPTQSSLPMSKGSKATFKPPRGGIDDMAVSATPYGDMLQFLQNEYVPIDFVDEANQDTSMIGSSDTSSVADLQSTITSPQGQQSKAGLLTKRKNKARSEA